MALLCVFAMLLSVAYKAEAETEFTPKIKETMVAIQAEAAKLGEPRIEGVSLFFGSTKINGNYQIVDDLKTKFGCTATFFVKKGDKYIRISTNVLKDGNRAVGTILDPKGAAMTAINKGEAFYGVVDIIGSQYDTGYTPIKNSAGETLGIYYIGYKLK
jgi:hypothetical protein